MIVSRLLSYSHEYDDSGGRVSLAWLRRNEHQQSDGTVQGDDGADEQSAGIRCMERCPKETDLMCQNLHCVGLRYKTR